MKSQRIKRIENYIIQHKNVTLDELCTVFSVSKNTIRRDINELEEKGTIKKVYGGVIANENALISFENRDTFNQNKKESIGLLAAKFIKEGDIVFIDSGTTTRQILPFVNKNLAFTLLTNSLDVINYASTMENVKLIVVGNNFKHPTRSFIGIDDINIINNYNINKAFMAATGVSLANGLTNSDIMEYHIKQLISKKTQELILLVDSSKFDKATLLTYARLQDVTVLITDKNIPQEYIDFCQEHNIILYYE